MTVGTGNTFLLLYFLPSLIILFVFIIFISPSIILHLSHQCAGPNSCALYTGKIQCVRKVAVHLGYGT